MSKVSKERRYGMTEEQEKLISAFELLKGYCKNRECNSKCLFYRELYIGRKPKGIFCGLCEIVASDDE